MVGLSRRLTSAGLIAGVVAVLIISAGVLGPRTGAAGTPSIVEARDYDSFWLWAGVRPQPALESAKRIYLLQGEVEVGSRARFVSRRPALPHGLGAAVWLVVRAETLTWPAEVYETLIQTLARWRAADNRVVGIQIDFDAHTHQLQNYAGFLTDLRHRLPPDCRLGVTGLLDWSANGDPAGLAALAGTVDEVVLQIYQGRHTIPGYARYLKKLDRLNIPFRIGLLQGGEWQAPAGLGQNPRFQGYVVFLRNP